MRNGFKMIWDTAKVFFLFAGCTLLFYYGVIWVSHTYQSYHQFQKPKGRTLQVDQPPYIHKDHADDKEKLKDFFLSGG